MKNNIYLCAFVSDDLNLSAKRFLKQSSYFYNKENTKLFYKEDLPPETYNKIKDIVKTVNRAYGFGIWKPQIVLDYFNKIPDNSILQYADIGCHFNYKGLNRFNEYLELTNRHSMLTFKYDGSNEKFKNKEYSFQKYFEYEYTKVDLINYLNIEENSKIFNSPQIWSGSFFLKKNDFTLKILENWVDVVQNINLLDKSTFVLNNHPKFLENRWDQSAFSLICKQQNVFSISASECEWAEFNNQRIWTHLENYPILAKRDLKRNFIKRFINRQRRTLRRLFSI